METHYARAFAELILLMSTAGVMFTIKKYSFYKYSYVFLLYGLSLLTSASGVFRYGNPVYGPKIKWVYDQLKKICANICLPFFVVEYYFYQLNMKSNVGDSSEYLFEGIFSQSKDSPSFLFQDVSKLIVPSRSNDCHLSILLLRLIGVTILHLVILCVVSLVQALACYFHTFGVHALVNVAYIFGIFWFSMANGASAINLWGLAVMISAFIDKFILSQQSELGWRLGVPVLLDELRILNLVFFTIFTAKALTD